MLTTVSVCFYLYNWDHTSFKNIKLPQEHLHTSSLIINSNFNGYLLFLKVTIDTYPAEFQVAELAQQARVKPGGPGFGWKMAEQSNIEAGG
jgi:hypothetical protein